MHKKKGSSRRQTKKGNSRRQIKRKSSKRVKKTKSNSKKTWEKFLKNKDSVNLLKKSWDAKNPQKHYRDTIIKLSRKYSNKK